MTALGDFFTNAYWWLSLIGGLHCLMLAGYALFFYNERSEQKWLLTGMFALMALYFFTGMFNRDNIPTPLHLLFILLQPTYFLLLPLLYLYCRRLCYPHLGIQLPMRHLLPMLLAMLLVILALLFHRTNVTEILLIGPRNPLKGLALLLPLALSLQTLVYLWLILRLLIQHRSQLEQSHNPLLQLRFRWLLLLTTALIINWLVRNLAFVLPLIFGDQLAPVTRTFPHAILLLTLYALALYGLKQLTHIAYLRGQAARETQQAATQDDVLSDEEKLFIRQLLKQSKDRQ